nr:sporulation protein YqfD [Ruminococcus sp.]
MIFGYVNFSIIGDNYTKLYNQIIEQKLPCVNLTEKKGVLTFKISVEYAENIKALCDMLNLDYEIKNKRGFFTIVSRFKKHIGILLGVVLIIASCIFLSNFVFRIKILCSDNTIKKDILAVLKENDAGTGSYIPNLNCVNLERELKQKVDGISWAGISVSGSTLTIDIVENIPKTEIQNNRLPSNLVAKRDAIIDKAEVFDGQLVTTVGSAVLKGETLVSGVVVNEKVRYKDGKEEKETHTKYVRSLANIFGTFEETVTVFQPFKDTQKIVSNKTIKKRYLRLFDTDVPMFISFPEGEFLSNTEYKNFSLFGFEFPIGVKKIYLNEFSYEDIILNEKEATENALKKLENYKSNFLGDYLSVMHISAP